MGNLGLVGEGRVQVCNQSAWVQDAGPPLHLSERKRVP